MNSAASTRNQQSIGYMPLALSHRRMILRSSSALV
jgi:hypothetical protein